MSRPKSVVITSKSSKTEKPETMQEQTSTEQAEEQQTPMTAEVTAKTAESVAEPAPEASSKDDEAAAKDASAADATVTAQAEPEEATLSDFDKKIEAIKADGSSLVKSTINALQSYVKAMAPGQVMDDTTISQQQLNLWRFIRLAIESEADFNTCYPLIIEFAREYQKAAFHDRYLYRGMEHIPLDKEQTTYFLSSLNIIKLAATSASKKAAMQQVDLDRAMNATVFSEEGRNRVIQYFQG